MTKITQSCKLAGIGFLALMGATALAPEASAALQNQTSIQKTGDCYIGMSDTPTDGGHGPGFYTTNKWKAHRHLRDWGPDNHCNYAKVHVYTRRYGWHWVNRRVCRP